MEYLWNLLSAMIGLIVSLLAALTSVQIYSQKGILEGEIKRQALSMILRSGLTTVVVICIGSGVVLFLQVYGKRGGGGTRQERHGFRPEGDAVVFGFRYGDWHTEGEAGRYL